MAVAHLEPLLDAKACVEKIIPMLGGIGPKAIRELLRGSPARVLPGGRRRYYLLSEVMVHLKTRLQADEHEEERPSLHRRRHSRLGATG